MSIYEYAIGSPVGEKCEPFVTLAVCGNEPTGRSHDSCVIYGRAAVWYSARKLSCPLKKSILPASGSCPSWRRPKSSTNQRIRLWFCPCQTEQSLALGDEALLQRTARRSGFSCRRPIETWACAAGRQVDQVAQWPEGSTPAAFQRVSAIL